MKFSNKKIMSMLFLLMSLVIALIAGSFYKPYMEPFDPKTTINDAKTESKKQNDEKSEKNK